MAAAVQKASLLPGLVTMRQADSISPNEEVLDQRSAKAGYRPDIEGLRAVAVVAVVLFHAGVPGVGGGFVGVDVFFVISGFLITGLLWREVSTTGAVGLRRFYGARARRLLPASATVGIVTAICAVVLSPPLQVRTIIGDGIASALYVSNYRFAMQGVDYFGGQIPPSPYQHYWSLGVEEQFYLIWPALIIGTAWFIRGVRRFTKVRATTSSPRPYLMVLALVAVLSFALSLLDTYLVPAVAFFSLPTRAWQLAAGGLVALTAGLWRRLPPRVAAIIGWVGLGLILLACTQLSATTPYPGTAALLPVLGAVLLIGAGSAAPAQGCGRVLAVSPMRAIGRISYSWYLWHWPVLLFAALLVGHPLGLIGRLATVLVSGGLAVLTLRFIENPLRFAAPIRRSAIGSLALGAVATAVAVGVGVALLIVVPSPVGRGPAAAALKITVEPVASGAAMDTYEAAVQLGFAQVQTAVAASAGLKAVPSNLDPSLTRAEGEQKALFLNGCMRTFIEVGHPECAAGDTASTSTVALIGDSNAAMWNPGFQQIATERHWRLEMLARAGCPLLDVPTINFTSHREYFECNDWRDQIVARLRTEHPKLIVLSVWRRYGGVLGSDDRYRFPAGFTPYDPAWIDSMARLVQLLRGTGAKVLVLGPIPDPQSVPSDCLSRHLDDATFCSPPRSMAVKEPGIVAETVATKASGGQYANITELFCAAERCPVIVGNSLVYFDRNHLTSEYVRILAPVVGALADRALISG
ncbi:acyltransferase [Mycobacterium numidiamassiliense]|uniref:Acyltransferase n=2 Tax=Mycobacterium numidiamassiliense TaxID=1841861 RepID=A0A2U3PH35_9MYCO|nr:acyltransferase [Mycobacterium numidiamassiliense]